MAALLAEMHSSLDITPLTLLGYRIQKEALLALQAVLYARIMLILLTQIAAFIALYAASTKLVLMIAIGALIALSRALKAINAVFSVARHANTPGENATALGAVTMRKHCQSEAEDGNQAERANAGELRYFLAVLFKLLGCEVGPLGSRVCAGFGGVRAVNATAAGVEYDDYELYGEEEEGDDAQG